MAVAMAIGVGMKSCTWRGRMPARLSQSASSMVSSSVEPGWPVMKYGTRYWSLPASSLAWQNAWAKRS